MNKHQQMVETNLTIQDFIDQQKVNPAPGAPLTPAAQALAYLNSMSHKTPREVYQDLRDILSQEPVKNPLLAEIAEVIQDAGRSTLEQNGRIRLLLMNAGLL